MYELSGFFQELLALYAIAVIGYTAKRVKIIDQKGDEAITKIILYITLPALIVMSMDLPLDTSLLKNFTKLIICSVYILLMASIIAYIIAEKSKITLDRNGVYQALIIFGNQGFLGYALCYSLFGKLGVVYAAIFNIFFLILIWTYGVYLISNSKATLNLKKVILNPGIISTFLGLVILILPIQLPLAASKTLQYLGSPTIALSMLMIGSIVADLNWKSIFTECKNIEIWIVISTKLVFIPLILLPFLFLVKDFVIMSVALLLAGMPSAPTTPLFAKHFGGDAYFGSVSVCMSMVFSLITLPFIYGILNILIV